MTDVASVQLAVERLLLEEPVAGTRSNGDTDVSENLGWLPASLSGTLLDALASPRSLLRSHPVQEDPVGFGTGEGAHLRSHRCDCNTSGFRHGRADCGKTFANHAERAFREAR